MTTELAIPSLEIRTFTSQPPVHDVRANTNFSDTRTSRRSSWTVETVPTHHRDYTTYVRLIRVDSADDADAQRVTYYIICTLYPPRVVIKRTKLFRETYSIFERVNVEQNYRGDEKYGHRLRARTVIGTRITPAE